MRPSFTPPPLLFWAYVALSAFLLALVVGSDEASTTWWGLLISVALIYGLNRGLKVAWWLLFIFDAWDAVAVWAIQPEGLVDGEVVVTVGILLAQLAVLLAIRAKAFSTATG